MSKAITRAVVNAVATQPWVVRRKDTIVTIGTGVVWALGMVVMFATDLPDEAVIAVGTVGTIVGALVNALTPGAITPSMAERLERQVAVDAYRPRHAAEQKHDDTGLPVYHQHTTAGG